MNHSQSPVEPIDSAAAAFEAIKDEVEALDKDKWSEADTRLKLIDRVIFDVLGWNRNEASVEDRAGSGFTDYTLRARETARIVVEAKKDAVSFNLTNRQSGKAYKLNGAVFNEYAKEAIDQAIIYSAFKNCELACVTNGAEWIIFRANRLGDGRNTLDGKGFVFSSLAEISENFQVFYDLMSIKSVESLRFRGEFQKAEGAPIRDFSYLRSPRNPATKRLLPRGEFSTEFDALMGSFFERLKGDQDPDMIQKCFVVTPESQLADEKLLRIADELVTKTRHLDTETGQALVEMIQAAQLQHKNRFILLVGNKGAGKSTFVDRFFKYVIPPQTAHGLVLLRVDLAPSSGETTSIISWLNRKLLEECEKAIFTPDAPAWDECVGKMFFDDYQRWANRTMSHLYNTDKNTFRIEFGRHIEAIRETRPDEYIRRAIEYIVMSERKIPCLVFDNTDHYSIPFQETVFQYARSLYEGALCIVILPITDKTSWQLSKQGSLQSFESESLSLPVPSPERVLERRISFLLEKLREGDAEKRRSYFLSRGIRLRLEDISGFAVSLNRIFVESRDPAHWIGGLVNHDIRRLLELTKDIISSPHLKLDDLLKAHVAGRVDAVPQYRIKNAIIKGRYDIYPVGEHSFVQNIFALDTSQPTTPLLGIRILQYLHDMRYGLSERQYEFSEIESLYDYFTDLGIHHTISAAWLSKMLETGLVLNYDPTMRELDGLSLAEIAPSGEVHLSWATFDVDYLQIMKDVTPLRDKHTCDFINSTFADFRHRWRDAIRAFVTYLLEEDNLYCQIPDHPSIAGQIELSRRLDGMAKV